MNRTRLLAAGVAAGAALAASRFTLAAGPAATVKIGFLESFSGVFSDLGAIHKLGALAALGFVDGPRLLLTRCTGDQEGLVGTPRHPTDDLYLALGEEVHDVGGRWPFVLGHW